MSGAFSYERYDRRSSSRRSALTYWVPLAITATVAAGGVAAWVWSARSDHHSTTSSSDDDYLSYGEDSDRRRGVDAAVGAGSSRPPSYGVSEGVVNDGSRNLGADGKEDNTFLGRMSGALRRSPSPQQIIDGASKRVVAGVAAAGAAMGSALSAIREEDGNYQDHNRWKEEQELKKGVTATSVDSKAAVDAHTDAFASSVRGGPSATAAPRTGLAGKRKTVAIIVSAESHGALDDEPRDSYKTEQATLLSHLPQVDTTRTNLLVLIYNPKPRSPSSTGGDRPSSLSSSYAAINTPGATPGEELASLDPTPYTDTDSHNELYSLLREQATSMVEKPSNVMTFNTPTGYTHMLKHLAPETVYIVDSLAGERGANVEAIKGWVGQIVVVVGGDGSGLGGLIDTEDEGEGRGKGRREQWWEHSDMVGLGKGVEVVDGVRFAEDWERRVGGRD